MASRWLPSQVQQPEDVICQQWTTLQKGGRMKKDDILAKSREENNNRDLYEQQLQISAGSASALVSLLLATALFILQAVIAHKFNVGLYALVFSYGATNYVFRAIELKRRQDIILAILYSAFTIGLTAIYVYQLLVQSAA